MHRRGTPGHCAREESFPLPGSLVVQPLQYSASTISRHVAFLLGKLLSKSVFSICKMRQVRVGMRIKVINRRLTHISLKLPGRLKRVSKGYLANRVSGGWAREGAASFSYLAKANVIPVSPETRLCLNPPPKTNCSPPLPKTKQQGTTDGPPLQQIMLPRT